MTDDDTPDNIRLLPSLALLGGQADPPENPTENPAENPAEAPVAEAVEPASSPSLASLIPAPAARRSPLETIAALESPALSEPIRPLPVPGHVPDTFRPAGFAAPAAPVGGSGLGALSFAAALAVVVAAMRGAHGALTGRWTRGAEGDRGEGGGRKGMLQSARDWGRRTLGRDQVPGSPGSRTPRGPGGGLRGGGGGGGGGRGPGPSRSSSTLGADAPPRRKDRGTGTGGSGPGRNGGTGPDRNPLSRTKDRSGSTGSGRGGNSSRSDSPAGTGGTGGGSPKRGPHRLTQSGGLGAKLRSRKEKPGSSEAGSTGGSSGKGGGRGGKGPASPKGTSGPKGTLRSKRTRDGAAAGSSGKGAKGGAATADKKGGKDPLTGKVKLGGKQKLGPGMRHGTLQAWEDADCRCRRCMKAYNRRERPDADPTTLKGAIGEEFERRWAKRRRSHEPVFRRLSKKERRKAEKERKERKEKRPGGGAGPTASAAGSGPGRKSRDRDRGWERIYRRSRERWRARRASHAGPGDEFWSTWRPEDGGRRRTVWESAGTAAAGGEEILDVFPMDRPRDAAAPRKRRPAPAPAAVTRGRQELTVGQASVGAAHTARPGTTATVVHTVEPSTAADPAATEHDNRKESSGMASSSLTPRPRSSASAVPGMAAEHVTEVTLDDVLDTLEGLTAESFAAYETCVKLAHEARQIRDALEELAEDLRTHHNILGRLTGYAMARLSEAMDLVVRKAEQMKGRSLAAAELSEVAEQAMFDAYRPISQATADAGLAVPSARVHNED
ncbi:hypothetical protein [Kitasatospora sp. NPDC004272]